MTLFEQLQQDWKIAFKAREKVKKDILNFVIAQIKQKQIDAKTELTDDQVMKTIKKEIKTRAESIAMYTKAGKDEEVAIEEEKVSYLEVYLPEMLSEEKLGEIVTTKKTELGIEDVNKQRGQLIGVIMKEYGAAVDGSLLNKVISSS